MAKGESKKSNAEWLVQWPTVEAQLLKLEALLRRGEENGSFSCALQTVALLRNIVSTTSIS